ncbi:S-adenosyl-L-methionine-dependent methyltransferase [Xylaria palmicola]|nr:S-adenosyl-L-methionine-dependent methyltransferase [Xylaria palmicola]
MASERSIAELAALIHTNTQILADGTKGQPGGDFSLAFAAPPPTVRLDGPLEAVRSEIIEAADELKARLLGPFAFMGSLAIPIPSILVVLDCLYRFDVAAHVPAVPGQAITYEALAARCGMPADDLRRVLQTAAAYRVFEEAAPDVSVRHNGVSALFALVPGIKDALGLLVEDNPDGARRFVESVRRYPGSGEPGHAALMVAERSKRGLSNDKDDVRDPARGFFDLIADDPERIERFRNTMAMATRAPGYAVSHFLDSVPWAEPARCPRRIVDVGGAGGDLCAQVLRRFPGVASATSVDLPEVIRTAAAGTHAEELTDRLHFAPYDFLKEPMPYAADAYVFRHIFHDWSDQYAARILRNLAPALRDGARVWINEVVLPELSATNHVADQRQRGADLMMKVGFNGKERSRRGWESVLADADERFRIENIVQPEGATDAVIEIVFRGE